MSTLAETSKQKRDRRRAESEARDLVSEARRILRKKSYRIPESVSGEIEQAAVAVESALPSPNVEDLQQAMTSLEQRMDKHLAFARKSTLREYSESIGVAVAIALLLRAFVVEAFQIPSGSMIPTLEIGDHIFVAKFSYGLGIPFTDKKIMQFSAPRRGDVVVFKYPLQREIDYIKRVVALPGEKVELRGGEVFIDGRPMPRELAPQPFRHSEGPASEESAFARDYELWIEDLDGKKHKAIHNSYGSRPDWPGITVPEGHVFVMGDNRDNSNDSRVWGTVPVELIKGKALIVWWSRGPTSPWMSDGFFGKLGELPAAMGEWFAAIRWRRFFTVVD
jgi:signal peptidase I